MMGLSYEDAVRCGIGHLWPTNFTAPPGTEIPPAPSRIVEDGMNKTERAFWGRLEEARDARVFTHVYREPFVLRLAGRTTYRPDFLGVLTAGQIPVPNIYEVKGFMRDDASVKIKVAAETFPWLVFIIVTRTKRAWQCRTVTPRGISREEWCPGWLS